MCLCLNMCLYVCICMIILVLCVFPCMLCMYARTYVYTHALFVNSLIVCSFRNGCIESEIVVGKSSNRKSTSKRASTWSESTISIGSLSEGKHLDDSPSVNGDLQDSKSLPDSIEGDIDKSDPESDENKRKSLIETESLASAENSSPRVSPNNDHSVVRKHSGLTDSVFEGGRGSAAMNHSAGSLVSVGVATKTKKWSVIRFFRYVRMACVCTV